MADTGLLITLAFWDLPFVENNLYKAVLFDKLDINEGMIVENVVAQMLRFNRNRLYFYSRSDAINRENHMEIDFLIAQGKKIAPVEVKSGSYQSHSSLDKFHRKFSSRLGDSFILHPKDMVIKDNIIHLPLYMAMFL
jgi:predicted AAA+ superfamily ATPase